MKKIYTLVILLSMGITQIYAQSCIECLGTHAPGDKATSIGYSTTASGLASFAGGNSSETSGTSSFAFGNYANATGTRGIALGNYANVFQADGIAIGSNLTSNAANSYVFGQYLTSSGSNSLTLGIGSSSLKPLTNKKDNSIMFGVTNNPSLTILKSTNGDVGYVGIGTDNPEEMAHVVGKLLIERTGETESSLQFKHSNKTRGIDPGTGGPGNPTLAPYYWDIYSDTYGLKFNTVNYGLNPTPSQSMVISRSGFVGIGTTAPQAKLHVGQNIIADGNITTLNKFVLAPTSNAKSEYWEISRTSAGLKYAYMGKILQDVLFMDNDGSIGVGTIKPSATLDVNGSFMAESATIPTLEGNTNVTGTLSADVLVGNSATIPTLSGNTTVTGTLSADVLVGNSATIPTLSGNTTVTGTLSANAVSANSAYIKGLLCAKEILVQLTSTADWPDFVFSKDYKLLPLVEVEQFIAENQHLPNVPSSAEVEANGIELGEMNALLLQKVEELTLYIIQMEKRLAELENLKK